MPNQRRYHVVGQTRKGKFKEIYIKPKEVETVLSLIEDDEKLSNFVYSMDPELAEKLHTYIERYHPQLSQK